MTKRTSLGSIALAAVLAACGDDGSDTPAAARAAPMQLRIAHLSPDAPPVDVCLARAGTGQFTGPVLEQAGGAGGLAFGQATRYLDVAAGAYDVRIVSATAADCAAGIVPDTNGVTLPESATVTVAAIGLAAPDDGQPGFALVPFVDDTEVASGQAKVRFIHASPGTPPVDVGAGAGEGFTPVFTAVAFGQIDDDVSATGYLETAPLSDATLSARATGSADDALVLEGVDLPAGAIVTVFAVGLLGGEPPLFALVCPDDTSATTLLSACSIAP